MAEGVEAYPYNINSILEEARRIKAGEEMEDLRPSKGICNISDEKGLVFTSFGHRDADKL